MASDFHAEDQRLLPSRHASLGHLETELREACCKGASRVQSVSSVSRFVKHTLISTKAHPNPGRCVAWPCGAKHCFLKQLAAWCVKVYMSHPNIHAIPKQFSSRAFYIGSDESSWMLVLKRLSTWAAVATKSPCDHAWNGKELISMCQHYSSNLDIIFYSLASYVGL
jgi:hypothetical protein